MVPSNLLWQPLVVRSIYKTQKVCKLINPKPFLSRLLSIQEVSKTTNWLFCLPQPSSRKCASPELPKYFGSVWQGGVGENKLFNTSKGLRWKNFLKTIFKACHFPIKLRWGCQQTEGGEVTVEIWGEERRREISSPRAGRMLLRWSLSAQLCDFLQWLLGWKQENCWVPSAMGFAPDTRGDGKRCWGDLWEGVGNEGP